MPIGPHHAFSGQRAFPRFAPRWILVPLYGVAASLRLLEGVWRTFWAWSVFERNCVLSSGVRLGPAAWCVNHGRREDILIGANSVCRGVLRREAFGEGRILIHENVYIGDDCLVSCADGVEILPNTLFAHGVQVFDNDSHPVGASARRTDYQRVLAGDSGRRHVAAAAIVIGPDAWIGFESIILKGVTVGEGSVVAAGSVVTKPVPPHTLVAGNPAVPIRTLTPPRSPGSEVQGSRGRAGSRRGQYANPARRKA